MFERFKTSQFALLQDYAHNDYLQFLAERGTVGFLIAGAFVVLVFVGAVRAGLRKWESDRRWLGLGCTGALAAILIHSAADFNLYVPANAAVLAWICGVAASLQFERVIVTESSQAEPAIKLSIRREGRRVA